MSDEQMLANEGFVIPKHLQKYINVEYLEGKLVKISELREKGYELKIIDQNSPEEEIVQSAKNYRSILTYVYGEKDGVPGYPVMKSEKEMIQKIKNGEIVIIQIYDKESGICVTNSYIEFHRGGFYLGGSGELPSGFYKTKDRKIIRGENAENGFVEINTKNLPSSVAMCARIAPGLQRDGVKFIDAHCRCSKGGEMADGTELNTGAASVHITYKLGLSPFALLPAFRIAKPADPEDNNSTLYRSDFGLYQAVFLCNPEELQTEIHLPMGNHFGKISSRAKKLLEQIKVFSPEIREVENVERLENPKFSLKYNGLFHNISLDENGKSIEEIFKELDSKKDSQYMQVDIEPTAENAGLIEFLLEKGFVFLGITPGIKESSSTKIHLGYLGSDGKKKLPGIDLPDVIDENVRNVLEEIDGEIRKGAEQPTKI